MSRIVFISHSSKDKTIADKVCAALESKQIQCWITPRDIVPGMGWAESIVDAIEKCYVFVLVFSANSNDSRQVIREVERAADKGVPIIPFRIEDIPLSKSMQYYIGRYHWLNAYSPPIEKHLQELVKAAQELLKGAELPVTDSITRTEDKPAAITKSELPAITIYLENISGLVQQDNSFSDEERSLLQKNISLDFKLHERYEFDENKPSGHGLVTVSYSALDKHLQERSLKVLKSEYKNNAEIVKRFLSQAIMMQRLIHQNIVRIYSAGGGGDNLQFFIEMECLAGSTVQSFIKKHKFRWATQLQVIKQLAAALQYLHQGKTIHGDLNSLNVMIDKNNNLKLAEFGIDRIIEEGNIQKSSIISGIRNYMSPEQTMGEKPDERSDIYSFGVIAYELCTGRLPSIPLVHMCQYQHSIPEWFDPIVAKCLQTDKQLRYTSIQEILSAMERAEKLAVVPKCAFHPEIASAGVCTKCAKQTCNDCTQTIGGKRYCRDCAKRIYQSVLPSPIRQADHTKPVRIDKIKRIPRWLVPGVALVIIGLGLSAGLTGFVNWNQQIGEKITSSLPKTTTQVTPQEATLPPIEAGKGRVIFDKFGTLPKTIITRKIQSDFLIGLGAGRMIDGISAGALRDLRISGINHFLLWTIWGQIETREGDYSGYPDPGRQNISWLKRNGAILSGYWLLFFRDDMNRIPQFARGRTFDEIKTMQKNYIKAIVARYPEVQIWEFEEPITQNYFGWSKDQYYEIFVSASEWIHEINPKAKVMINMYPDKITLGSGLYYDPNQVLDDLLKRGFQADIIGIKLHYRVSQGNRDTNGYPKLDWIKGNVDNFRRHNKPIMLCDVDVPGIIEGKEQWENQANWLESLLRLCKGDKVITGVIWQYIRDVASWPSYGLENSDYSYRPITKRLIQLVNEWNPQITHDLNGRKYLDLAPGEYDVIADTKAFEQTEIFRVTITEGETIQLLQ